MEEQNKNFDGSHWLIEGAEYTAALRLETETETDIHVYMR